MKTNAFDKWQTLDAIHSRNYFSTVHLITTHLIFGFNFVYGFSFVFCLAGEMPRCTSFILVFIFGFLFYYWLCRDSTSLLSCFDRFNVSKHQTISLFAVNGARNISTEFHKLNFFDVSFRLLETILKGQTITKKSTMFRQESKCN